MTAFLTLLKTETKLVLRGIDTIFFGVGFPLIVAVFMGILMKDTDVFQDSFAAVASIGICATGLMGMPLTIADYRHRKILKRYAVTPMRPSMILFVQFLINFVISCITLVLVYGIMNLFFDYQFQGNVFTFFLCYLLVVLAMYSLGMLIASAAPNLKTANLLCTLLYFPMIFLSGTVIPYAVMPNMLQKVMDVMPLTQGIKLMNLAPIDGLGSHLMIIALLMGIAIICMGLSIRLFKWK